LKTRQIGAKREVEENECRKRASKERSTGLCLK
jgi:hypothetical protein